METIFSCNFPVSHLHLDHSRTCRQEVFIETLPFLRDISSTTFASDNKDLSFKYLATHSNALELLLESNLECNALILTVDATKSLIKFSILGINKTLILIDNDLHSCKLLYYKLIFVPFCGLRVFPRHLIQIREWDNLVTALIAQKIPET